jgi:hypothetical protein
MVEIEQKPIATHAISHLNIIAGCSHGRPDARAYALKKRLALKKTQKGGWPAASDESTFELSAAATTTLLLEVGDCRWTGALSARCFLPAGLMDLGRLHERCNDGAAETVHARMRVWNEWKKDRACLPGLQQPWTLMAAASQHHRSSVQQEAEEKIPKQEECATPREFVKLVNEQRCTSV